MKNRTWFRIFHGVFVLFYILMYSTGVFNLRLPIYHNQIGILLALVVFGLLLTKYKIITKILFNYLKLSLRNKKLLLFKISVWLLLIHFLLSIITGILMTQGIDLYAYHILSKFIVPILLILHLTSNYIRKSH